MRKEQDYIKDIAEIRSMMERSSKFLSLSGWAGILAGIYALAGAWVAYDVFEFQPEEVFYSPPGLERVIALALAILILALFTAIYFSWRKSDKRDEKIWTVTSRRLLVSMAIPLLAGGILIMVLISKGLAGLVAPLTLMFYGLALYTAGFYTIREVRFMGVIQIVLVLLSAWFIEYGLLFWSAGFGLVHIVYGIYIHFKYER